MEERLHYQTIARKLSRRERDLLIEHVDGSANVEVAVVANERRLTRSSLNALGLIRYDRTIRPTKTTITEDGRAVLASVLADYADALVRAGYTGYESPRAPASREDEALREELTVG